MEVPFRAVDDMHMAGMVGRVGKKGCVVLVGESANGN